MRAHVRCTMKEPKRVLRSTSQNTYGVTLYRKGKFPLKNPGKLKLQRENVVFKNLKTGKVDQYSSSDIESVCWLKRACGNCLKIILQSGIIHRYDGIRESEYDKLSSFVMKHYDTTLEKVDCSVRGWNWGVTRFRGNALNFEVEKNMAFEIPLTNVSHATTNKNEVTLEFHQNDDAAVSLMELRFHIPSELEKDVVQDFYKNVMSKADIIQATGDAIVTFDQVQCLTPRGRYDIKIYPTFLQLHGKTFDYKIPYATVLRLFLLPHNDRRQMFFVVSLDPPIKQGQTRYHFLILLFNKDDEMTTELALSEEEIQKKYEGKLTREMSGTEYEVISKIFKAVVNRKITVPGVFVSQKGDQAIGCSYKAATGLLYPLERGLIFVHKPPIHIRFDEVSSVNFARSAGSTRSFDFDVETKSSNTYTFVGIEKDEYGKLYDFIRGKKLRVKNFGSKEKGSYRDDMVDSNDESEEQHDAYLERMKQEGRERDEDESEDESDESFNPGESGSEVAEEYDSNPETTSDSESGEDGEPKKPKPKKHKEKKASKPKESKSSKSRKKKKNVDPNRPKRPLSAYFIWLSENREKIKTDNPGISITDLTKKAADIWRNITDKSKWEKLQEESKEKYNLLMEEYKKTASERPDNDENSSPAKTPKKSSARKSDANVSRATGDYKSKEFISSSESSSNEDKPKKKKMKKETPEKTTKAKKADKKEEKAEKDDDDDEEVGELPSDEEILSSPEASESGSAGSEEEEEEEEEEEDEEAE
ncbi:FACT complex subunit SSRP1 isoform X1 [Octopus sinensis]|uniref:FACT complex subunit SSRP1 n=1 Tax=Octopus sinensis TaxID=2607531 RepID=A0A7E6EW28_9MOLL|nr:FACT complex subunit SSRP1 isoform X1 [Octopus sinensis]